MANLHLRANIDTKNLNYKVGLSLVEFQEENVFIIYSPALDLQGYGYSTEEAKKSFSESLHEFFKYTTNKNTLDNILKKLGWQINGSKKKPKFNPPKDSDLVTNNSTFSDIINTKNYKVFREDIEFAY